jgi:hypothetical protein
MTPMRVPPDDLQEAPELAVLAVLDAALDQAVLSLIAQHGEISDHDSLVGLPPAAWLADVLASAAHDLQHLIERYRLAALDDARYRTRHSALTPPPLKTFAE